MELQRFLTIFSSGMSELYRYSFRLDLYVKCITQKGCVCFYSQHVCALLICDRLLTTMEVWTRPPRMQLVSYREATIHQGGELLLECRADGVPAPALSWVLPDRSVLTSTARSTSHISMDTNGTLHILVSSPSDRGVYRCVASNSAGAASASVRVHVSSLPPVIQQVRQEHLLLSPGRTVNAHCSARGAPPPTLRWRIPDGTLVRPSQFLHGNLFVLPNGTLHIRSVGPKDSGSYECTVSNAVGADRRTVRVEIQSGAGETTNADGRQEEEKVISSEKTSLYIPNEDGNVSMPRHSSHHSNDSKISPPSLSDRSKTMLFTPTSSSHPPQNTSMSLLSKSNKTVITLSQPSTVSTNYTKVYHSIVNNTSPDKSKDSDVSRSSPDSPFSKARIISTSPSITAVQYGGSLQLHCSVTGNPSPIIIWRTPSRKLVDKHFRYRWLYVLLCFHK